MIKLIESELIKKQLDYMLHENTIKVHGLLIQVDSLTLDSTYTKKDPRIDIKKTLELGNVIIFFEDDVKNKLDICMSMIYNKLGLTQNKIRARKLQYKDFKPADHRDFFNKNHLSGYTPSTFGMGLFNGDELISGMIFRRPMKGGGWEISRFCTKLDTVVHGGASKILKRWDKGFLISYSNNMHSTGNTYSKTGFEEQTHTTAPSYYYTDFTKRIWRFACKKSKDPAIKHLTEKEQALNGYLSKPFGHSNPIYRIYDYGHKRWVYTKYKYELCEKRKVYVYMYTSPINKSYIGISNDPGHRKYQHITDVNSALYHAIQEYGYDNLKFEILYVAETREEALFKESQFIHKYDTYNNGYNRTTGGEGSKARKKLTEEEKADIRACFTTEPTDQLAKRYKISRNRIKEICSDMSRSKLVAKGEKQGASTLTTNEVIQIKTDLKNGVKRQLIADTFKVSLATIKSIATGRNWNHVEVEGFKVIKNDKMKNTMSMDKAKEIRSSFKRGVKIKQLSEIYKLNRNSVRKILDNKTYRE